MKLLLIFTGGTIGSAIKDGYICVDRANVSHLLNKYKELYPETDITLDVENPYTILSENMNGNYLRELIKCVAKNLDNYDGILVAHGTDTLAFSGAALEYAFAGTDTPIVLISSNYVLDDPRANGFDNFRFGIEFIKSYLSNHEKNQKNVYISYRNDYPDGSSKSLMLVPSSVAPSLSFSDLLYEIEGCGDKLKTPEDIEFSRDILANIDALSKQSPVLYIPAFVGMRYPAISPETKIIILDSYHSGTINTADSLLGDFVNEAASKKIPVYLSGLDSKITYESTKYYKSLGIILLPKESPIASYIKLWFKIVLSSNMR